MTSSRDRVSPGLRQGTPRVPSDLLPVQQGPILTHGARTEELRHPQPGASALWPPGQGGRRTPRPESAPEIGRRGSGQQQARAAGRRFPMRTRRSAALWPGSLTPLPGSLPAPWPACLRDSNPDECPALTLDLPIRESALLTGNSREQYHQRLCSAGCVWGAVFGGVCSACALSQP